MMASVSFQNRSRARSQNELKLGEILIGRGIIGRRHLAKALLLKSQHNQLLGEILLGEKLVSHHELEQALQEQYWRRQGLGWNKQFLSSLWQSAA